ncbi:MAG: helix-turn-helix domain-containing protein [Bacillota bacterium]|nr:helix-turn-helix domain-containing protein [Bacillota bacterium]
MICMNLVVLRKRMKMTQEEVADHIGVSRQAVVKWEKGESLPDLEKCTELADLFQVSMDDLIRYEDQTEKIPIPPKGKYFFGSVTVGERGQIVIPKKARDIFRIKPGSRLLLLGDESQGIAILPEYALQELYSVMKTQNPVRKTDWSPAEEEVLEDEMHKE